VGCVRFAVASCRNHQRTPTLSFVEIICALSSWLADLYTLILHAISDESYIGCLLFTDAGEIYDEEVGPPTQIVRRLNYIQSAF